MCESQRFKAQITLYTSRDVNLAELGEDYLFFKLVVSCSWVKVLFDKKAKVCQITEPHTNRHTQFKQDFLEWKKLTFWTKAQFLMSSMSFDVFICGSFQMVCREKRSNMFKRYNQENIIFKQLIHDSQTAYMNLIIILTPVPVQGASSNTLSTEFIPRTLGSWNNMDMYWSDIFSGDVICPLEKLQNYQESKNHNLFDWKWWTISHVFFHINNSSLVISFKWFNLKKQLQHIFTFSI
jgi:hypothetical protein